MNEQKKYLDKEGLTVLVGKISEKADKTDLTAKADKSEMSVVAGTGNDIDKTTITLKSGTSATVLTSHQSLSGYATEQYVTTAISTQHTNDATISDVDNLVISNNPLILYNVLDILYANSNGEKIVDSSILDPSLGYTPIGICVAGTGFFGDGEKARFQSLKYMNYTTPETGSLTSQGMYWGNYGTDLNMIPNIQVTHNGGANYGYFTVDYYDSLSQTNKIPSVFDTNNKWNTSILGEVNQYATTDIDGRNKTDLMLASATSQSTWKTDTTITNESGAGYAPAACCCDRYHTVGTNAGDWYLGASGEMCMIIVQKTAINSKLAQIAAVYSTDCMSSLAANYYWSSTEYNSNDAYGVNASDGYIDYYSKDDNGDVVAILQY